MDLNLSTRSLVALLLLATSFTLDPQVLSSLNSARADDAKKSSILVDKGLCADPEAMMRDKFIAQIEEAQTKWIETYEALDTAEDVAAYQQRLRNEFKNALGRMWDRSPLNAQITGKLEKKDYRVENVVFESVPGVYVTGALFLPREEKFKAPYPAMTVVCGHSDNGKAYEPYQGIGILAAMNGLAAFVVDPIDQGERFQYLKEDGGPVCCGVGAHNLVGVGSILVGRSAATFEIWDGMRAIDYLQSRDDIVADKIGVCGTSGGGTQSSYLMALDERIALGAPSCYICSFFGDLSHNLGPQDAEQNIFGQLAFGMDHADYLTMRAPMPTLMCCVTNDFFKCEDGWKSYRYAARIFSRLSYSNRLSIVESDSGHSYTKDARVATIRWALRWLAGRDEEIVENDVELLKGDEILSIKSGKGVLSLPGAKRSRELNLELARQLEPERRAKWRNIDAKDAGELVRARIGARSQQDRPAAKVVASEDRDVVFETDSNIYLTSRVNFDENESQDAITLFISDQGRTSEKTNAAFDAQDAGAIAAVELRGYGETQAQGRDYYTYKYFGSDGSDYCLAYLLGKSYVGLRVDDLLAVASYYREKTGAKLSLKAEGLAGTVALAAAIVEPDAFGSVELLDEIPTWISQLENDYGPLPMTNAVHGVLYDFDVDDLANYLKEQGRLR